MEDTFPKRVYQLVARIPRGKVATYGQLALLAGSPRASRIVGAALPPGAVPGRLPVLPKGLRRPGNPAAAAGGRGRALPAGWAGGCKGLLVGNAGRCVIFPYLLPVAFPP